MAYICSYVLTFPCVQKSCCISIILNGCRNLLFCFGLPSQANNGLPTKILSSRPSKTPRLPPTFPPRPTQRYGYSQDSSHGGCKKIRKMFTWKDVRVHTKDIRYVSPSDVEAGSFLREVKDSGAQELSETIQREGYNDTLHSN